LVFTNIGDWAAVPALVHLSGQITQSPFHVHDYMRLLCSLYKAHAVPLADLLLALSQGKGNSDDTACDLVVSTLSESFDPSIVSVIFTEPSHSFLVRLVQKLSEGLRSTAGRLGATLRESAEHILFPLLLSDQDTVRSSVRSLIIDNLFAVVTLRKDGQHTERNGFARTADLLDRALAFVEKVDRAL
jgi:hypothetical protein